MLFKEKIQSIQNLPLTACGIDVLQVNVGYRCNMACKHCHIEAGPAREETMEKDTVDLVLGALKENQIKAVDITGGAPELNPHFRYLVKEAKENGCHVVVRTNLTIFFEDGMEDLDVFFADNSVEIIASLPYYTENNVDRVRGKGTFRKSITALGKLNNIGYGKGLPGRSLNLVYNPSGSFLSPHQGTLEEDYKRELHRKFGIVFDRLYAFTNMPIGRFRSHLEEKKGLEGYEEKLRAAFNSATLGGLMCRHLVNVGWDGRLYDCDFNQMLGFRLECECPSHIVDFEYSRLGHRKIAVGDHCYACTAGQGST